MILNTTSNQWLRTKVQQGLRAALPALPENNATMPPSERNGRTLPVTTSDGREHMVTLADSKYEECPMHIRQLSDQMALKEIRMDELVAIRSSPAYADQNVGLAIDGEILRRSTWPPGQVISPFASPYRTVSIPASGQTSAPVLTGSCVTVPPPSEWPEGITEDMVRRRLQRTS